MQKYDEHIEKTLDELEHLTESIHRALQTVHGNDGDVSIGDIIDTLYERKQQTIDTLNHLFSSIGKTMVQEDKIQIEQRLSGILGKESLNLQMMESYTNFLAQKLRILQRQKSLRVYTGG